QQLMKLLTDNGISRRSIVKLKHSGGLTRGGEIIRTIDTVNEGDEIHVVFEDSGGLIPNPDLRAGIAYEDEDVIVFDKPPYMAVHPSIKHSSDTLGNLFCAMFPDTPFRAINRLDRNTSGLCVCAKNRFAAAGLTKSVDKVYYAAVDGELGCGEIDVPIGRVEDSIIYRNVTPNGQYALTLYETVLHQNGHSLARVILKTGRTHQIRVHFAYIGFPLCGDDMYGGNTELIQRQALHCGEVSFTHPVSGERITLRSELPEDIRALFDNGGIT
ncbi:MAG: RluA family pseudouridine synthase, partial [Ruminococcaceae bacterium]|nr:RluA family pseudouridine synthase [Oscillospiraceae bacterium]